MILEERKQFEADLELAKKLQLEEDDENDKSGKARESVDPDSDEDDPAVWKCKKCTMKNKLPDYKCEVWGTLDNKAFDDYYDQKSLCKPPIYHITLYIIAQRHTTTSNTPYNDDNRPYKYSNTSTQSSSKYKNSSNFVSSYMEPKRLTDSKPWTCRYCSKLIKSNTYWPGCRRARTQCDKDDSHWVQCKKSTTRNDPLCRRCEDKMDKEVIYYWLLCYFVSVGCKKWSIWYQWWTAEAEVCQFGWK